MSLESIVKPRLSSRDIHTRYEQSLREARLYFSQYQTQGSSFPQDDAEADLAAYDSAIAILETFRQRRAELAKYVELCQSQTAPIRKLPYEILSSVFSFVAQSHMDSDRRVRNKARRPPYNLIRVCVGWYDVAYRTPHLWNRLRVDFDRLSGRTPEVIQNWLKRSQRLPLSLDLWNAFRNGTTWEDVLSCLLKESPRWQHVTLRFLDDEMDGYGPELEDVVWDIASTIDGLPTLESLTLSTPSESGWHSHPILQHKLFRNAPCLRELSLDSAFLEILDHEGSPESVNWPNLESLEIRFVELGSATDYLHLHVFANLKSLSLENLKQCYDWTDIGTDDVSIFHRLSVLSIIEEYEEECLEQIFSALIARARFPKLESLDITLEEESDDESSLLETFGDFMIHTECGKSLKKLCLQGFDDISLYFNLLSNLHTLAVVEKSAHTKSPSLGKKFCEALRVYKPTTARGKTRNSLLNLRRLHFTLAEETQLDLALLASVVESRCHFPSYSLESVVLNVPRT